METHAPARNPGQDSGNATSLVLNNGVSNIISNRPVTVTTPGSTSQLATIAALQQSIASQLTQAGVSIPPNLLPLVTRQSAPPQVRPPSNSQRRVSGAEPQKANFKVRVTNPQRKKEYETYVLRDVTKSAVSTPTDLRKELYKQFGAGLISCALDFSVGYIKGNSKVTIRSAADVDDVWNMVTSKAEAITLWCDRVVQREEDSSENESDHEDDVRPKPKKKKLSALEKKNERVENLVEKLRKKHNGKYTTLQLRLWAEVVDGGTWK